MVKSCCDSYHTQFSDFSAMLSYHEQVRKSSLWERTEVKKLQVAALDKTSPLYEDMGSSLRWSPMRKSSALTSAALWPISPRE